MSKPLKLYIKKRYNANENIIYNNYVNINSNNVTYNLHNLGTEKESRRYLLVFMSFLVFLLQNVLICKIFKENRSTDCSLYSSQCSSGALLYTASPRIKAL